MSHLTTDALSVCCFTGAQGIGLLAASALGNTLEDLLALTVAGLASYVAVLNLPLKRSEIKSKVGKVAGNFVESVTAAMAEVCYGWTLVLHVRYLLSNCSSVFLCALLYRTNAALLMMMMIMIDA